MKRVTREQTQREVGSLVLQIQLRDLGCCHQVTKKNKVKQTTFSHLYTLPEYGILRNLPQCLHSHCHRYTQKQTEAFCKSAVNLKKLLRVELIKHTFILHRLLVLQILYC
jgi:hypothetical protein